MCVMVDKTEQSGQKQTADQTAGSALSFSKNQMVWIGFVVPVLLACVWEWAIRSGLVSGRLMPPPSVIFKTLHELAKSGELQMH